MHESNHRHRQHTAKNDQGSTTESRDFPFFFAPLSFSVKRKWTQGYRGRRKSPVNNSPFLFVFYLQADCVTLSQQNLQIIYGIPEKDEGIVDRGRSGEIDSGIFEDVQHIF